MAKARSGGKRGAGGESYIAKSAVTAGGTVADLSAFPLQYGSDDSTMTAQTRAAIDAFEAKRRGARIEYSRFVDANGNVIEDNRGGKGSVSASLHARLTAFAMSHNHPREDGSGQLGGTFSPDDIGNFGKFNQVVYRAAAAEGTYTIAKGSGFRGKSLHDAYKAEDKRLTGIYKQKRTAAYADYKKAAADYSAGKVSYSAVKAAYASGVKADTANFNELLVGLHNFLLANQKNYGYSYSLERSR